MHLTNSAFRRCGLGVPGFGILACSQWNSLPNWVVTANNTKISKKRIDQYRQHQDIIFDFRAQIEIETEGK